MFLITEVLDSLGVDLNFHKNFIKLDNTRLEIKSKGYVFDLQYSSKLYVLFITAANNSRSKKVKATSKCIEEILDRV